VSESLDSIESFGKSLVALGEALQDPDANLRLLTDLSTAAGCQLSFRFVKKPTDALEAKEKSDSMSEGEV